MEQSLNSNSNINININIKSQQQHQKPTATSKATPPHKNWLKDARFDSPPILGVKKKPNSNSNSNSNIKIKVKSPPKLAMKPQVLTYSALKRGEVKRNNQSQTHRADLDI